MWLLSSSKGTVVVARPSAIEKSSAFLRGTAKRASSTAGLTSIEVTVTAVSYFASPLVVRDLPAMRRPSIVR